MIIERKILAFAGNLIPSIQLKSMQYISLCILYYINGRMILKLILKKLGCECLDIVGVCKDSVVVAVFRKRSYRAPDPIKEGYVDQPNDCQLS